MICIAKIVDEHLDAFVLLARYNIRVSYNGLPCIVNGTFHFLSAPPLRMAGFTTRGSDFFSKEPPKNQRVPTKIEGVGFLPSLGGGGADRKWNVPMPIKICRIFHLHGS